MKYQKKPLGIMVLAITLSLFLSASADMGREKLSNREDNLLVIGFGNKLNSNFYPKVMIADKMGISTNALDTLVNNLLIKEMSISQNKRFKNIIPLNGNELKQIKNSIQYKGSDEDVYSDLKGISVEELKKILDKYNSVYLVVFSQYYLKKQEKPFPTLFHILNFSVYNSAKEEIYSDKVYTNSFELVDISEMKKIIQKNVKKNLSALEKAIK